MATATGQENTMKTIANHTGIRLIAVLAVAAPLAAVLGTTWH
jgi:hypothetical protein